jgi:hypothetical protein
MCDATGIERRLLTEFMKLSNRLWIAEKFHPGRRKRRLTTSDVRPPY